MTSDTNYNSRLQELGSEDISRVDFTRDIRGLKVLNADHKELGIVDDLLFDIQSRKVRYAIINMHDPINRKILVPIGVLHLNPLGLVKVTQLTPSFIDHLPDYQQGEINPGVENMIRLAYSESELSPADGPITGHPEIIDSEGFYTHAVFNTNHFFRDSSGSKPNKTVKAVFDDGLEAETALSELLAAGFSTNDVELSSALANKETTDEKIETPQTANGGSLLSIKINNTSEAVKATEILNKNGSVTIFEQ